MERNDIVIVGGGLVGQTLAERLTGAGRDVTLIESDPHKARELSDLLDVRVIEGNGATPQTLRDAGIERSRLVVASTDRDEVNVIVGMLAAEVFEVPQVVVRVRDKGHEESFQLLDRNRRRKGGASIECALVNPESAAVERIASLLEVPGALDVTAFMDGKVLLAGFRIAETSDFAGLRVSDMSLLFAGTATLAVAIHRRFEWLIPHGQEQIQTGDLVYFAISRDHLNDVLGLVGVQHDPRGRILIAGATPIGIELARRLEKRGQRVKLLDKDRQLCERAAESLKDSLVIHGNVTDQALLEDEEIERVSTFVAVTEDHETNLVAGLLTKRLGAGRALVLVDNPALVAMMGDIAIDAIISQRLLTIGLTMQHIRGGTVRSGAALLEDEVEVMEVEAVEGSRLTSGPLMKTGLPNGVLVAALQRGDEILVPSGRDQVQAGDRVLLIADSEMARKLSDFL
jgi:trk system potassium uptake protein TrkA